MNYTYLIWDFVKIAVPIAVVQFLPDLPELATIELILYGFAALLGVDSAQKIISATKSK